MSRMASARVSARFDDLILVDHEVLAQARQRRGGRGQFEVAQAALEVRLVGKDGERGGSARAITASKPLRIEVGANEAL